MEKFKFILKEIDEDFTDEELEEVILEVKKLTQLCFGSLRSSRLIFVRPLILSSSLNLFIAFNLYLSILDLKAVLSYGPKTLRLDEFW